MKCRIVSALAPLPLTVQNVGVQCSLVLAGPMWPAAKGAYAPTFQTISGSGAGGRTILHFGHVLPKNLLDDRKGRYTVVSADSRPLRGRQSGHFLETASLYPPLAALRRFPRNLGFLRAFGYFSRAGKVPRRRQHKPIHPPISPQNRQNRSQTAPVLS